MSSAKNTSTTPVNLKTTGATVPVTTRSQTSSQQVAGTPSTIQGTPSFTLADSFFTEFTNVMQEMKGHFRAQNEATDMLKSEVAKLRQDVNTIQAGSSVASRFNKSNTFQSAPQDPHSGPYSPYQPKRFMFGVDASGFSGFGSPIPQANLITDSTDVHPEVVPPSSTFATPASNISGSSNPYLNFGLDNSYQFGTNLDAGSLLSKQMQELKDLVMSMPGLTPPYNQVSPTCYNESRFTSAIANLAIPKNFNRPHMKQYDGTTDPAEHVALYQEKMDVVHIPPQFREACFCRGFGSTLTGAALRWLINQPLGSIGSYAQLVNMFTNQFSCNRVFEKLTSDLYRVVQQPEESLKDYLSRFNREIVNISNLNTSTAIEAFRMGLKKDSPYYDDLVMTPCKKLHEIRTRALKFVRLEEDKLLQDKTVGKGATFEPYGDTSTEDC